MQPLHKLPHFVGNCETFLGPKLEVIVELVRNNDTGAEEVLSAEDFAHPRKVLGRREALVAQLWQFSEILKVPKTDGQKLPVTKP